MTPSVASLKVKIFADGADKAGMLEMAAKPWIAGLTTNPTLMRKAGIADYRAFAKEWLKGKHDGLPLDEALEQMAKDHPNP